MQSLLQTLKGLGPTRLSAIGGVGLFLLIFLFFLAFRMSDTKYSTLFSELEPTEAQKIVEQLEKKQIKFEVVKDGTEIRVPGDKVQKLRLSLAEMTTVNIGSVGGYEIFDKSEALGTTNFVQNVNLLRALEGELSKTIRTIETVSAARVHLVLPKREMFTREQQVPSASVIIKMKPRENLSQKQVMAIQRIVAAAVPKLETKNVSIMDSHGNLLTKQYDDDEQMLASSNEEYRRNYENRLNTAVQDLLEKAFGPGKVRSEISVEMDFSHVVTNQEIYNPEQQVVRSTTSSSENQVTEESDGAVTVEQNLPNSQINNGNSAKTNVVKNEETVNYEISKEIINKVRNTGVVKRISAAVMVDGVYENDPEGNRVYKERSEKEMETVRALVRSAIGYDADRGDMVEVVNMKFIDYEDILAPEKPLFAGFSKEEILKIVEGLGVALVAILVIVLIIKPLVTKAFEPPKEEEEEEHLMLAGVPPVTTQLLSGGTGMEEEVGGLEELIDIAKVEGRVKASSLRKIGEIIDKHPEEALNIIRNWMYKEGNN
ncbi:MAG: Flagellar M-ring protein [Alphaproteobacteria bacterium ADurb.Bin438]|nr:MAG: Flagellar M-ring protein [Alphaproteobacteria bacterium ADurb.Bin438]